MVVVVVVVLVTEGTARLCPIPSAGCAGGKPRSARGDRDGSVCVVTCVRVGSDLYGVSGLGPRGLRDYVRARGGPIPYWPRAVRLCVRRRVGQGYASAYPWVHLGVP